MNGPAFLRPRTTAILALLALGVLTPALWASPPVTLTDGNDAAHPITWSGGPFFVPNIPPPVIGSTTCDSTHPCDETALAVNVSSTTAATKRIKVIVGWPISTTNADFDLYVFRGSTQVTRSAGTYDPEIAVFPAVNDTYNVRIVIFDPQGQSFTATAYLEPIPAASPAATGPAGRYHTFAAPNGLGTSAGEPSIGVDWSTNVAATQSDTQTLFTSFDDCSSPAADSWVERSAPTSVIDFDPILFTDFRTDRSFTSLLVTDIALFTTGCSLSSHTDDDGELWLPNDGCGHPAGSDHQSLGGGPYHAPIPTGLSPLYGNAVYYCAQDPGALLVAPMLCARSDDGGVTFNPSVVATSTECGGIHGHIKVAPDGSVYVPSRQCSSATTIGNAVVVSTDNGLTWSARVVPSSATSSSDPSVAVSQNDVGKPSLQASNTVYLGYCDGDGKAKVAVSRNQGTTWGTPLDVGASAGIKNCVFPEMVAGDDNRAAVFFLGTSTPGDTQSDTFPGVWHGYVATTFDGGATWGLADATPTDPVQIGKICLGGISCTGGRNLLDFNDATLDSEGRLVAVFADGCPSPTTPSTAARPRTARRLSPTSARTRRSSSTPPPPPAPATSTRSPPATRRGRAAPAARWPSPARRRRRRSVASPALRWSPTGRVTSSAARRPINSST